MTLEREEFRVVVHRQHAYNLVLSTALVSLLCRRDDANARARAPRPPACMSASPRSRTKEVLLGKCQPPDRRAAEHA